MFSIKNTIEMFRTSRAMKMLKTKTALGLDISDKRISLALIKRTKNGVELLASASVPIPDGAIKNGSIENAEVLAKAIKGLKKRARIRTTRTAVSLFTEPVVTQIMGIPKQVPSNIGQFVQDQVKNVAVLPANNIALDFCGVAGAGSEASTASRLLVVAADDRKVDEIIKICSQADLTVEAIEPPLLAYTRVLYGSKVKGKFDCNVLIVILQENSLTLCVFKKQAMDFIRTISINKEKTQPDELCQWLVEQINTVIQFYDVEVPDSSEKWEITVVTDGMQLPRNAEATLKAKVACAGLQILTREEVCQTVIVNQSGKVFKSQTDNHSPVAIGLAMKLLDTNVYNIGSNLLPKEIVRARAAQKGALITANIIAAVFLLMVLAVIVPERKIGNLNEGINCKKNDLFKNAHMLYRKRASVNKQVDSVSNQINKINSILGTKCDADWPGLLSDIGKAIPKNVSITSLSGKADSGMLLKGLATSNEAVYWFVERLNKSDRITSASITETERDNKGFIDYEISCTLASGKGK